MGPGIRMDKADHAKVTSTAYGAAARKWQAKQKALILQGKMAEAMQMDIDDIRSKFGSKYDPAIKEMIQNIPKNAALQKFLKDNNWSIQACKLK
jgi:filamentous hemagglutinin